MCKAAADINAKIKTLTNGGKIYLPVGTYDIDEPIVIDTPCIGIEGEIWNYSSDPNGVFESEYGTKLRMRRNDIPALYIGRDRVLGGNVIRDIGIQGNIVGMDTRERFDYADPAASAGICLDRTRVDQTEFSKLSFCGLGAAISATGNAEIDACTFEKLNTDGCCIGIYYAPRASYYATFRSCVVADTPRYGFFSCGENAHMHHIGIESMKFVRNGGAFPEQNPYPSAAVCLYRVSGFSVCNCTFDHSGLFWYYEDDATENNQRQPSRLPTPSLWVEGNGNRIIGNSFSNGESDAIVVNGDRNIIMNNISDRNICISGNDNIVISPVFTNPEARIIVSEGSRGTEFVGVSEERIVRK